VSAHLKPEAGSSAAAMPSAQHLAALGQLVQNRVAESAVVWRQNQIPRVRKALDGEAAFLRALLAGQTLAQALDAAGPGLDVSTWLALAVQSGLLLAVV
jgi:hypothetical protein